jgi:tetratricopeptide (TPR) repeat protein
MLVQIEEDSLNSKHPYLLGALLANIQNNDAAEEYMLRAIELSPNKQAIRAQLIRLYMNTEREAEALELARETYELDTSKNDLWMEYALVAFEVDKERFEELLAEAAGDNSGKVGQLLNRVAAEGLKNKDRE